MQLHWKYVSYENTCLKFVLWSVVDEKKIIGWDYGLVPNRQQTIAFINGDPDRRRIYAAFGADKLN